MAETAIKAPLHAAPDPDTGGKDGGDAKLGRALDIAGIAAAIVLGVIIFDVISGGRATKLGRKLFRRGKGCDDCGDQAAPGDG